MTSVNEDITTAVKFTTITRSWILRAVHNELILTWMSQEGLRSNARKHFNLLCMQVVPICSLKMSTLTPTFLHNKLSFFLCKTEKVAPALKFNSCFSGCDQKDQRSTILRLLLKGLITDQEVLTCFGDRSDHSGNETMLLCTAQIGISPVK